MNREIIFRGKSIGTGGWLYGHLFNYGLTAPSNVPCISVCVPTSWEEAYNLYAVQPDTIGQYTGLIDKNGKKIYEGDILQDELDSRVNHIVKYDNSRCSYTGWCSLVHWNWEKGNIISQEWINECGKTVIGNIHDNPDLR